MTNSNPAENPTRLADAQKTPPQETATQPCDVRRPPEVLQDLDRLEAVLSQVDGASAETSGQNADEHKFVDRRRDERRTVCTEIVLVETARAGASPRFSVLQGRTLNLSHSSVAFVTAERLASELAVAFLQHPDFPASQYCFELTLFRSRQLPDGQWEHGAVLRPMQSGVAAPASLSAEV